MVISLNRAFLPFERLVIRVQQSLSLQLSPHDQTYLVPWVAQLGLSPRCQRISLGWI
jgi:hypothetical protein